MDEKTLRAALQPKDKRQDPHGDGWDAYRAGLDRRAPERLSGTAQELWLKGWDDHKDDVFN